MNSRSIVYILIVIVIVSVLSSAFIYINYSTAGQTSFGEVSVIDDEGYQTNLTSVPTRIVSLSPSCTEIAFAIGVGDKVVGVTNNDDAPYDFSAWIAAGNMTSAGGYGTPNLETIFSLKPDLILTDTINDALLPTIRHYGYSVVVLNPSNISGICQDILIAGRATGANEAAKAVVDTINSQIDGVKARIDSALGKTNLTRQPTVYCEVWYDSSLLMSAGEPSFINDAIVKAGGKNVFGDSTDAYPASSSEAVVYLNPDVILLPAGSKGMAVAYGSVEDVKARPGWNTISAVKEDRVYVIDQNVFARPGPRIGELVQDIAACLYPQIFSNSSYA
jgi:iron complex transport system substrate-binding protein